MAEPQSWNNPTIVPADGAGRPSIAKYPHSRKFRPGDSVQVNIRNPDGSTTAHGEYMVERVTASGTYTLCAEDGDPCQINGRKDFTEMELTLVD
ncbi:uncharacterized protein BP01DRAFT_380715 [Aspergillus saccharolyticus JOP 1030-1]|uniref:Uncharacterized protein n=1 Tax=Aspergillus saccharolyticus JOP 1030-1 TaxID=1450539 RepID=A0A318ZM22_9EURO|nr:hypothetical protein BP01DRAFT_380715 [Aspergillus saccharolyticus JOP 1030-1]PYH47504.1 hypothetical protein BP01DRAFT_380715 [Aspergillus saccharolyticus JOP 1030-1]